MAGGFERDDSAGDYGTWSSDGLSLKDRLLATASDVGSGAKNLFTNLVQGFSPIGTSEQGNMALQVPPIARGFADSLGRLVGTPNNPGNAYDLRGVPELDAPILADGSNVLLTFTGGQAFNPLRSSRSAALPTVLSGDAGSYNAFKGPYHIGHANARDLGDVAQVGNIAVNPEYQRQGIGRALMDYAADDIGKPLVPDDLYSPQGWKLAQSYFPEEALQGYSPSPILPDWKARGRWTMPDLAPSPNAIDGDAILAELSALSDTGKPSILGSAMAGSSADLASPAASAITQPPIRAYSGTFAEPFGTFKEGPWMSTNPDVAGMYAGTHMLNDPLWNKTTGRIYPVEINPQNPFTVPRGEPINESLTRLGVNPKVFDGSIADAAREKGHDFAIYDIAAGQDGPWAHLQYQALKPNTVRSATTGETLFSDNRPSLLGSALATAGEQKPIRAYHGTDQSFDAFDLDKTKEVGFHFGDRKQVAMRRLAKQGPIGQAIDMLNPFGAWRRIPVDIEANQILEMSRDPGSFQGYSVAKQLVADGKAPEQLLNEATRLAAKYSDDGRAEATSLVRNWLIDNGYDTIKYPNLFEGGGDSYMTLGTGNVKHARTGKTLFSDTSRPSIFGSALATAGEGPNNVTLIPPLAIPPLAIPPPGAFEERE